MVWPISPFSSKKENKMGVATTAEWVPVFSTGTSSQQLHAESAYLQRRRIFLRSYHFTRREITPLHKLRRFLSPLRRLRQLLRRCKLRFRIRCRSPRLLWSFLRPNQKTFRRIVVHPHDSSPTRCDFCWSSEEEEGSSSSNLLVPDDLLLREKNATASKMTSWKILRRQYIRRSLMVVGSSSNTL